MNPISVGTMLRGNGGKASIRLERLVHGGFESYQIHWWADLGEEDLAETARRIRDILDEHRIGNGDRGIVSALALYGNPLRRDREGRNARESIRRLIDSADLFGCPTIGLFTGRLPGCPWEESLPAFKEVFSDLCARAADRNLRLAMENCPMDGDRADGDWNLAFGPEEWEILFNSLPSRWGDVLGLEWEPAHQIVRGLEPLSQLRDWVSRVFHVHGKDACRKHPEEPGEPGGDAGAWIHVLPGRGDTDWSRVLQVLSASGYTGSVDIEGYHDPSWNGEREIEGQKRSMEYLRQCRDGYRSGSLWEGTGTEDER